VYVVDRDNYRIRRIDADGTIRTIAGKGRVEPFTPEMRGDGGLASEAAFLSVDYVAVDNSGNIYVSDMTDVRIRRIDLDGKINTVAGAVNASLPPDENVSALSVTLPDVLVSVIPDGTIFLAASGFDHIWRIGSDGLLHRVPSALFVSLSGELLVTPSGGIYHSSSDSVYTLKDGNVIRFAGADRYGYSGDGGPATSAMLTSPWGLAVDRDGGLVIADYNNHRVRKVDQGGLIHTVAGNGQVESQFDVIGNGAPATSAVVDSPRELALDHQGNLYIGHGSNLGVGDRVRKVGTDGIIGTFAGGTGLPLLGPGPFPATSVEIQVNGLAVDSQGDIFLADSRHQPFDIGPWANGSIYKIAPDGTMTWFSEFRSGGSSTTAQGQLFVNRNDELFALKPEGRAVEKIAPDGLSSVNVALSGDFAQGRPTTFTFDATGNLFVARQPGPVRKIAPDGAVTTIFGGSSPNWSNGDGPSFRGAPTGIMSMITDDAGNLYFSDGWRSRVRMIPTSTCQGAVYPLVAYGGTVSAASYRGFGLAPGEIITIFGVNLGPEKPEFAGLGLDGRLATNIGGVRVLFDGVPAPMIYASATQVSAIVPYEMAGKTQAGVVVEFNGFPGESSVYGVYDARPGIFTLDASGKGQAAALNADNSVNGLENPVARGSVIVLYASGEGQTDPPGVNGAIAGAVLPKPVLPVRVQIGGQEAGVDYAGAAPGFAAGLMQVNARVPESVTPGPAVPVVVQVGDKSSQPGVTIGVK
jgi:uncharacterized protein (TIGR03437 family)